jgi:hypothetical protein
MRAFVLLAPKPLSGKTTIAVALAQALRSGGRTVALARLGDDGHANADKQLFARLAGPQDAASAEITIIEAAAGEPASIPEAAGDARAVVVVDAALPVDEIGSYCAPLSGALAGIVLNRVPKRRATAIKSDFEAKGLRLLGMVPEDRVLASPTLGEVAEALKAEKMFFNSNGDRPLDRTLIASISADPGQEYFTRTQADTVIVRSDKPDLQLGALNAGAGAMIITGEFPLLGYVLNRAEEDGIPLLRTKLETVEAVNAIEDLFGSGPFAGGTDKVRRAAELAGEMDLAAFLS